MAVHDVVFLCCFVGRELCGFGNCFSCVSQLLFFFFFCFISSFLTLFFCCRARVNVFYYILLFYKISHLDGC